MNKSTACAKKPPEFRWVFIKHEKRSVSTKIRSVSHANILVKRCSPLALPLGELSPQVTERVLRPFLNDNIIGCCLLVWSLFALSVLAALGHLSQGARQGMLARYIKGRGKMLSRVRLPFGHSLRSATSPIGRGKGCPRGRPKGA